MRRFVAGLSAVVLVNLLGCGAMSSTTFVLDVAGAEAWLAACHRNESSDACARESARTLGGCIAEAASDSFGPLQGTDAVSADPEKISRLLSAMKVWDLRRAALEVSRFLPSAVCATFRVFVVANGHPLGDAYVRSVRLTRETATLVNDGEPVVVLNAASISGSYPGDAEEQADLALGVLRHEFFHVLFRTYRRSRWPSWAQGDSLTSSEQLLMIVLDEGIGHFCNDGERLVHAGFPLAKGRRAFERLEGAVAAEHSIFGS
ncbi:MAG: hypothetical protein HYY16_11500 [Planctomycetes bacterium]|nr:hypothetical protein [Planctomycetota bacterium]